MKVTCSNEVEKKELFSPGKTENHTTGSAGGRPYLHSGPGEKRRAIAKTRGGRSNIGVKSSSRSFVTKNIALVVGQGIQLPAASLTKTSKKDRLGRHLKA